MKERLLRGAWAFNLTLNVLMFLGGKSNSPMLNLFVAGLSAAWLAMWGQA